MPFLSILSGSVLTVYVCVLHFHRFAVGALCYPVNNFRFIKSTRIMNLKFIRLQIS